MLEDVFLFITLTISLVCGSLFFAHRMRRYLRFLQQEDYTTDRFIAWIQRNRAIDKRGWPLALLVVLAQWPDGKVFGLLAALIASGCLYSLRCREENPLVEGRKPLVLTARASRIERFGLFSALLAGAVLFLFTLALGLHSLSCLWITQALLFPLCPLFLVLATRLLHPHELRVQSAFKDEALSRLKAIDPLIIGITGSYGKTTSKIIFADLLTQTIAPAFCPPNSINTLMGITRELREKLEPCHRYAVIEMGAYGEGSIERLCAFTPPMAGIITSVGIMHLERFGSVERIYRAKSELARAIPDDGILVCNGDDDGARRIAAEYPKRTTLLYGLGGREDLACSVSDIHMTRNGMRFTVQWEGRQYSCRTPMFGRNAVSNIAGAFTMACALGADPGYACAAIANIEPVNNRLNLTKSKQMAFLNDAYNSNPKGFSDALEVLSQYPAEKKILVTPGMIELGEKQREENHRIAVQAAAVCNEVFLVGATNRDVWREGLFQGGMGKDKVKQFDEMPDALHVLKQCAKQGPSTVVLLENDLGDVHESKPVF